MYTVSYILIRTGESVPVTKMALPNSSDVIYSADTQKRHILYCGTAVLMTHGDQQIRAMVVRTGNTHISTLKMLNSCKFP